MSKYFDMLAYLMGKQAGGGGGDISVVSKSFSANGTYTAPSGKAYSPVTVSVPASAVDTGTKSITSNGDNQDVVGYAAVDVDVPNSYAAGDEGKAVSNGELVAQTSDTVTQNGTVDTTLINSLTVNVSGGGGGGASGTFSPAEDLRSITLPDCVGKKNIVIWPTSLTIVTGTGRTHYGELLIDGDGFRMVGSNNSGGTSWSLNPYGSGKVSWDSTTGTMTITAGTGENYGGYYRSGMTYGYHAW